MKKEYDVFVSFKNLDGDGTPTRDSLLAKGIFDSLSSRGLSVFFSNVTLEQLGAAAFQKAIDDSLDSARILVAVGTSRKNLDSEWVRYEWGGFVNDILSGLKPEGRVFAYVEGMKPSGLPRGLRQTQVIAHGPGSEDRLYSFIANALGISQSPGKKRVRHDALHLPIQQIRANLEEDIFAIYQVEVGVQYDKPLTPQQQLDEFEKRKIMPLDMQRNVRGFLHLSTEILEDQKALTESAKIAAVNTGAYLLAQLHYHRRIVEMKYEFWGHGLWHMHRKSDVGERRFYFWSAVAATCPQFDYDYSIYRESLEEHNRRWIKEHGSDTSHLIDVLSMEEYVSILEFREKELVRLSSTPGSHGDFEKANEWRWPKSWGNISWTGPIIRGFLCLNRVDTEIMRTRQALERYRGRTKEDA
jgi:hypothetical protein